ncbi:DUF2933 domain-containing protein [Arthrobacter sp. AD-310]
MDRHDDSRPVDPGRPLTPLVQGVLLIAIGAAGVYLVTSHWLHILDALPYLGVVLMMGMHLFMHGGHGGHGGPPAGGGSGHAH